MRTATRDTTNDGVNDPVRAPWGQTLGTAAGSFTPSLVQRHRHGHPWTRRQTAPPRRRGRGNVRRFKRLPAVPAHRQPEERECPEKASKLGGQPDAIFAWPPVWPTRHGPSCR
jgi:hypothetical protein